MSKDEFLSVPLPMIEWKHPIRDFTHEDTKNMATSLRVHGQIEPVVCKPPDEKGFYEGVCGGLRYEGAKYACMPEVLVRVHEFKSESEVRAWQLAENLHRKELMALERAEAYKKLYETYKEELGGVKDTHIVETMAGTEQALTGEKPSTDTIYKYLQVAGLPTPVKTKIGIDSNFGLSHGIQLGRLKETPDKQLKIADEWLESSEKGKPLTTKILKRKVDEALNLEVPGNMVDEVDVGEVVCPKCGKTLRLVHREKTQTKEALKHHVEELRVA